MDINKFEMKKDYFITCSCVLVSVDSSFFEETIICGRDKVGFSLGTGDVKASSLNRDKSCGLSNIYTSETKNRLEGFVDHFLLLFIFKWFEWYYLTSIQPVEKNNCFSFN